MTKNGDLIQTIQINGEDEDHLSDKLLGLRDFIRKSINSNLNDQNISCWIHTIRKKANLDDSATYPTILSQNIHNFWVKKNYWDDKYINTLFLSFVYKGKEFYIKDLKSLLDSFNPLKIKEKHHQLIEESLGKLDSLVSKIDQDLKQFGSRRLGIVFEDDKAYCEITKFFKNLLTSDNSPQEVSESDISKKVGSFSYAVGSNKLEIIDKNLVKYLSIISLKEYYELSSVVLDKVLQLPSEFVITEVFHPTNSLDAKKAIDHQKYIASVSKEDSIIKLKAIDKVYECEGKYNIPLYKQQISISVLNENIENLDRICTNLSFQLSKIGLLHVKEDINLENIFWSQIPGNFKYLRRESYSCLEFLMPFASLHNFPAGSYANKWGRANTILRTERGTPYFFNFHDEKNNNKSFILGTKRSGKNTAMNFLISESMKYNPNILFISTSQKSWVFVKSNGGKIIKSPLKIDPFKLKSISGNNILIFGILDGISGKLNEDFTEEENQALEKLKDYFIKLPEEERSLSKLSEFDFENNNGAGLKLKLSPFLPGGEYYSYFDHDVSDLEKLANINQISFEELSDSEFSKKHYPAEDRFLNEYRKKFERFTIFREILYIANIIQFREKFGSSYQILKTENYENLCTAKFSGLFYSEYYKIFDSSDILYLNSINFSRDNSFFDSELWKNMQEIFGTRLYLSDESVTNIWQEKLFLSDSEYAKIAAISPASRLFLLKKDGVTITLELSIAVFVGILHILSAEPHIISKCEEYTSTKGDDPDNWIIEFYDSIK